MPKEVMRLDKFIATHSAYSRSAIAQLVKAKRIAVNTVTVNKASIHINPAIDTLTVDGRVITALGEVYLMLNKPEGYICANKDAENPTVIDLLAQQAQLQQEELPLNTLQVVGRLDKDTTGLVLLTTNGDWNHRITAPSSICTKTYHVETANPLEASLVDLFTQGILLKNETKTTKPAHLKIHGPHQATLEITEGKYHQVKRMFAATGNKVVKLHRAAVGNICLDTSLQAGEYRHLTQTEISLPITQVSP